MGTLLLIPYRPLNFLQKSYATLNLSKKRNSFRNFSTKLPLVFLLFFATYFSDSGKFSFGVDDTIKACEMGASQMLLIWENLEHNRYVLKNNSTGEEKVVILNKEQEANQDNFRDSVSGAELETLEMISLVEWFAHNYKKFGTQIEFVTNKVYGFVFQF